MSGNVEINPGPTISLDEMTAPALKKILQILSEGDDTFVIPGDKAAMLDLLAKERPAVLNLAIAKALGMQFSETVNVAETSRGKVLIFRLSQRQIIKSGSITLNKSWSQIV